ncbi:MAG TPA: hypothetical protein VGD98_12570 [Ktedonobacteraceae bacterium]
MTPTLLGRWQTRCFLLATIGLCISLLVGLLTRNPATPLLALFYVLLLGLAWDALYQFLQTLRWDRDWPTSFQVAAGILEGAFLWGLIQTGKVPGVAQTLPFPIFLGQYGSIWLLMFILTQGMLRTLWPKWRYQGGQWIIPTAHKARPMQVAQPMQIAQPIPQPLAFQPQQVWLSPQAQAPVPPFPLVPSAPQLLQQPSLAAPARPFVCACGYTAPRAEGRFCPRCGRGVMLS